MTPDEGRDPSDDQIERLREEIRELQPQSVEDTTSENASPNDLERLGALNQENLLTDEEFQLLKSQLYNVDASADSTSTSSAEEEIWRDYLSEDAFSDLVHDFRVTIPDNEF